MRILTFCARGCPNSQKRIDFLARNLSLCECAQCVYRWERPADVDPQWLPSLAWGYARVHGSAAMQGRRDVAHDSLHAASLSSPVSVASSVTDSTPGLGVGVGFAAPVLARAWGTHVQLLQV